MQSVAAPKAGTTAERRVRLLGAVLFGAACVDKIAGFSEYGQKIYRKISRLKYSAGADIGQLNGPESRGQDIPAGS